MSTRTGQDQTASESDAQSRRHEAEQIAAHYRQMRQGLEDTKNAPGSADFSFE